MIEERFERINKSIQKCVNSLRELNAALYSTQTAFESLEEARIEKIIKEKGKGKNDTQY